MIRLFLALISFLSVALGGLWYGSTTDTLRDDDGTFENAPLTLENKTIEAPAPDVVVIENVPVTPVAGPGPPIETKMETKEAAAPKVAEVVASVLEERESLSIQPRILRFGFRVPPAKRTVDTVVLHSSYNVLGGDVYSVDRTIDEYEQYGVGAHYLIDRSGVVLRLVEEGNIAYHAGSSKMPDGRKNVNDFSIGIELIATEESGYTDKQYSAVNALIADIKSRYKIKSVVGHADIAPGRKSDPWKFDWKKLK